MKDYKLTISILIITNVFTIILFTIALVFYKDCYNKMIKLGKQVKKQEQEIIQCKDELYLFWDDYFDCKGIIDGDYTYCEKGVCKNFNEETNKIEPHTCKWYERFYDEFHEEVGAFE